MCDFVFASLEKGTYRDKRGTYQSTSALKAHLCVSAIETETQKRYVFICVDYIRLQITVECDLVSVIYICEAKRRRRRKTHRRFLQAHIVVFIDKEQANSLGVRTIRFRVCVHLMRIFARLLTHYKEHEHIERRTTVIP